jgi:hypothetical protein
MGCVEELEDAQNRKPEVWFTRGPEDGQVIFSNSVDFEWQATDVDDDLGMGAQYVRLEPSHVEWEDMDTGSTVVFDHPPGWVRVYDNVYEVLDLPDTNFAFSVRVVDDRDADSIAVRDFIVRFDDQFPVIDSVDCPPTKPGQPSFTWTYRVYAHDVARTARAATPQDSLEYSYRFVGPAGVDAIDSEPEWSNENDIFEVTVDGQNHPGQYTFRYKVRDRAGNASPEGKCQFTVEN